MTVSRPSTHDYPNGGSGASRGALAYGGPYYSLADIEVATALPAHIVRRHYAIPALVLQDKPRGRPFVLEPVPGRYLIPADADFEAAVPARWSGFRPAGTGAPVINWRPVDADDFEDTRAPTELKRAFDGQVHPVLRDPEGFERYLVPGGLDIWFQPDVDATRRQALLREMDLVISDASPAVGYYRTLLRTEPPDRNRTRATLTLIAQANALDEVRFAEPDQMGMDDFGPDRSVIAMPLGDFESAELFWNYAAINLPAAHEITRGTANVTVIIVDSGFQMNHQDLQASFRPDWPGLDLNFVLGEPPEARSPDERAHPHGTRVAGIVGSRGDIAGSVRGMAPGCRILPVKISGQAGGSATPGYGLRAAAIMQALRYLQPGERAVFNLSWKTNGEHIGIREALREAEQRGVAIVTSAGNYLPGERHRPDDLHYPSAHAYREPKIGGMCVVAAVGRGDRLATYSYYGSASISVAAPGGEVGDTGTGIYTTSPPGDYAFAAGTSFAAPHVAGLLALVFSVQPDLTATEAVKIVRDTADAIDHANPAYPGMLGSGRINAHAAVSRALDGSRPRPRPEPTEPILIPSRVNINTATREELMLLPLVGPWRAGRVIDYRETHGLFASVWSLALTGTFDAWTISQLSPHIMT